MWQGKSISVALPTYNERDSIRACIREFEAGAVVDEIIVVNNNAAAGTTEEVAETNAREVYEPRQGYGWACRRGLEEAGGDLVALCEPDGTFRPRDLFKLLAYSEDFDLVVGTRTANGFIWEGANMGFFLRWGNWAVAKIVELLFNTTNLTDVGCTMRVIHAHALRRIAPHFAAGGSHFGLEMLLLAFVSGLRVVQVPVNYTQRVGVSSVTGDLLKTSRLATRMLLLVGQVRLRSWARRLRDGKSRSSAPAPATKADRSPSTGLHRARG